MRVLTIMGGVQLRQGPRPQRAGIGDRLHDALGARREALDARDEDR